MWAQEESSKLRELKERLGVASRIESDLENLGRSSASSHRGGRSNLGSATRGSSGAFYVGTRVRVIRGRRFQDFGAGDIGTVIRVDVEGSTVTVAFDGRAEPLQVATRHLEIDTRSGVASSALSARAAERGASASPSRRIVGPPSTVGLESPTAKRDLDSRWFVEGSGNGSSDVGRRATSMPPPAEASASHLFAASRITPSAASTSHLSSSPLRSAAKTSTLLSSPVRGDARIVSPSRDSSSKSRELQREVVGHQHPQAHLSSAGEDRLRTEAAELRRAADAAAAAENRAQAALFDAGAKKLRMDVTQGMNTLAVAAAGAAREEAEALAEAVEASAHATATATASTMAEVASLRLAIAELQKLISQESEQRASSVRDLELDIEQLRTTQRGHLLDAENSLQEEQKRLSRKQAELVSLCLSLQTDQSRGHHVTNVQSINVEALESGLAALQEQQSGFAEQISLLDEKLGEWLESHHHGREQINRLDARINGLGFAEFRASLADLENKMTTHSTRVDTLAKDVGLRPASNRIDGTSIDDLASRIDVMVKEISAKAERETLPYAAHHDALVMRVDRMAETLASEVVRLEGLHRKSLQESITGLEQRESEHLRRLSAEADRHASELREVASNIEAKAIEAIKVGQRAREALESHCEMSTDQRNSIDVLRQRVEALGEGLAVEARFREDAIREEASRVGHELHTDRHTRQEAEMALQRLRGEVDVLREELLRRKEPSLPSSPRLATMQAEQWPGSTFDIQSKAPPVVRFSSAPVKERPDKVQPQQDNIRWGSQIHASASQEQLRSGTSTPVPNMGGALARLEARWGSNNPPTVNPYGLNQAFGAVGTAQLVPGSTTPPLMGRSVPGLAVPVQQASGKASPSLSCSNCGSVYMPDGNFCRRCGKKKGTESQGSLTPPQPPWQFHPSPPQVGQNQNAGFAPTFGAQGVDYGVRAGNPAPVLYGGPEAVNIDSHRFTKKGEYDYGREYELRNR